MTTIAFFIVLGVILLFIIGLIISIKNEDTDSTTFFATAGSIIAFMGLLVVPMIVPSRDRITRVPLPKYEYVVEKVDAGLIITYDKYYAIISDYKVVVNFNDSTEVIAKEQTSYYRFPITMEKSIEIQGETYPLIEIYK